MFDKIYKKVKRNAKCIGRIVMIGGSAVIVLTTEIATEFGLIGKICEGCDEDNPANFIQTAGSVGVALVGTLAEYATGAGAAMLIFNEIENNWTDDEDEDD